MVAAEQNLRVSYVSFDQTAARLGTTRHASGDSRASLALMIVQKTAVCRTPDV